MGKWNDYQVLMVYSVNKTHQSTLSLKKTGASKCRYSTEDDIRRSNADVKEQFMRARKE
jgi:hypothetical protein